MNHHEESQNTLLIVLGFICTTLGSFLNDNLTEGGLFLKSLGTTLLAIGVGRTILAFFNKRKAARTGA